MQTHKTNQSKSHATEKLLSEWLPTSYPKIVCERLEIEPTDQNVASIRLVRYGRKKDLKILLMLAKVADECREASMQIDKILEKQ